MVTNEQDDLASSLPVICGYGETYSILFILSLIWSNGHFCVGMNYIKMQLEREPMQSSQSEQMEEDDDCDDYFDLMKDNVQ